MVENNLKNGENAGIKHFLLFPQSFQKASSLELLRHGIIWYRISSLPKNKIKDTPFALKDICRKNLNVTKK